MLSNGEKESVSAPSSSETGSDATFSYSEKELEAQQVETRSASVLDSVGPGTSEAPDTSEGIPEPLKKIPGPEKIMTDSEVTGETDSGEIMTVTKVKTPDIGSPSIVIGGSGGICHILTTGGSCRVSHFVTVDNTS